MSKPTASFNQILHSDCLEAMKSIESASIDLIVTDPPFGIGFMGKAWDTFKQEEIKKANFFSKRGLPGRRNSPATRAGQYNHSKDGNRLFQDINCKMGEIS